VPSAAALAVLAATVVAGVGAVAVGSRESAGESPSRLVDPSANNRLDWWGEALQIVSAEPLSGAGADTFKIARKRYRDQAVETVEPHSVPLQFLAGTGPVGLLLFLSLVAAAAWSAVVALRRHEGAERAAAAALAVFPALWLFHALVDFPWNFVAVTGPALFAAGVLAAADREPARVRSPFSAAGALALCLVAIASVASPWLAERSIREVGAALDRGDLDAAADAADRARSLDPLALEPLFAQARVQESARELGAARRTYADAVRLQPANPEAWLELGLFEASRDDLCPAYFHLNEAYTLDPAGTQWVEGGPLDQARAFVNAGKCG
jgi:O-antigen ligase